MGSQHDAIGRPHVLDALPHVVCWHPAHCEWAPTTSPTSRIMDAHSCLVDAHAIATWTPTRSCGRAMSALLGRPGICVESHAFWVDVHEISLGVHINAPWASRKNLEPHAFCWATTKILGLPCDAIWVRMSGRCTPMPERDVRCGRAPSYRRDTCCGRVGMDGRVYMRAYGSAHELWARTLIVGAHA